MHSRRLVALPVLALGLAGLGVAGLTVAGTAGPASPAAPAAPAASVTLVPQLHSRLASRSGPMSTAQCEKQFHIACYAPAQLQAAYDEKPLFDTGTDGTGQTIVIVDAFGSTTIAHDLGVFDRAFGLPAPPDLSVLAPAGPIRHQNAGWAGETTLDVEWAHAMAPGAKILLVETPVSETEGTHGFPQIETAEQYVVDHHLGGVISQSFSATEETFPTRQSLLDLRGAYVAAAKAGISVLTASGDSGAADVGLHGSYYAGPVTSWPDSDPLVTGVGGTHLQLAADGTRLAPDTVWNDTDNGALAAYFGITDPYPLAGGGGLSEIFGRPSYQDGVAAVVGSRRGVPDIALSAACDGGVETYQSYPGETPGWYVVCGTSEATPLFAGIVALADQAAGHPLGNLDPALYAISQQRGRGIVDVRDGTTTVSFKQGGLHTVVGAQAVPGYDLAAGVGTVDAARLVPSLVAYDRRH